MSDGAHLGMGAEAAMKAVIGGGDGPSDPDAALRELEAEIRRASAEPPMTYDSTANLAARIVLEHLERHPQDRAIDEHEVYQRLRSQLDPLDLTGFMWGWAVNAARAILELPPVPNPAILVIEVPE